MKKSTKHAIGLRYNEQKGDATPTVIAKGYGDLAQAIIASAEQNGVLIHEDPYLSQFLGSLDLGQEIPQELYFVIAELLAYSYVLQGKVPQNWQDQLPGIDDSI
jgi:flagellar biosynthesis protein